MNWKLLLAVGLVVFFGFRLLPRKVDLGSLEPVAAKASMPGSKSCLGKDQCIVVYLAPWCPHCSSSIPLVKETIATFRDSANTGAMAVVGMDEPQANEAYAARIGESVFVDNDGDLRSKLKVGGVPHWLMLNAEGKVVKSFAGAPNPKKVEAVRYLLGVK